MADNDTTQQGRRRIDSTSAVPQPQQQPDPPAPPAPEIPADDQVDVFAAPAPAGPTKMKAPDNCAPITLGGKEYAPDGDGFVEIPAEFVNLVQTFGFAVA